MNPVDLLCQLLAYDAWTTRQLLKCAATLSDDSLDQEYDIGHRSIRRTFVHLIRNMEVWCSLIEENNLRDECQAAQDDSINALLIRLQIAADRLATTARQITGDGRWHEMFVDSIDGMHKEFGLAIAHVLTHSMHHRAQLLYLLRRAGVVELPEGDIFSWHAANSYARMIGREETDIHDS